MSRGRKIEEHDGQALAAARSYAAEMVRIGEAVSGFEHLLDRLDEANIMIASVRVKVPLGDEVDYLIIVRARQEGRGVVGFHAGTTLRETLVGTIARLSNGSMKWKDDEYAD